MCLFSFLSTFSGSDNIMTSTTKKEICFFKGESSILDFTKCTNQGKTSYQADIIKWSVQIRCNTLTGVCTTGLVEPGI